jgi:type II secretion system protein I
MNARGQGGFLLLEVIAAAAIVAVALFALMDSLSRCLAAARSVQNYSVAETLLANKSHEFRVERAEDMQDQEGTFEERAGFAWRRTFEATETEGLWKQTITVTWPERSREASDSVTEYRYLPRKQR